MPPLTWFPTGCVVVSKDAMAINEPRNLIIANLTAKLLLKLRQHLTTIAAAGRLYDHFRHYRTRCQRDRR